MHFTVSQIAELVDGNIVGDKEHILTGIAGIEEASNTQLTFLKDDKNKEHKLLIETSKAGAFLLPENILAPGKNVIHVKNPLAAFAKILKVIETEKNPLKTGIHPTAVIAPSAKIGNDVFIGPLCVVEDNVVIKDKAYLQAQVYVGQNSLIGEKTFIYPQVIVREDISIGNNCIIHSGTVIGSDGYGFYFANGQHNKIPQVGTVVIEDNVEIGSNSTIDRATTGKTWIKKGTKIDNLVQIAHNVEVGENCLLVAQVGIAGSTKLGKGVVLAGQVGVADHVKIADGTQVGAQSGIKNDTKPGDILFGSPAQPIQDTLKQVSLIRRLPELFKEFKKIKEMTSHE